MPLLPSQAWWLLVRAGVKSLWATPKNLAPKKPTPKNLAPFEPFSSQFSLPHIDVNWLSQYQRYFGFAPDAVPLTFYYLLFQRAQLASMLDARFTVAPAGLVHRDNQLTAAQLLTAAELSALQNLHIHTQIELAAPNASGRTVLLMTNVLYCAGALIASGQSRYQLKSAGSAKNSSPAAPASASATQLTPAQSLPGQSGSAPMATKPLDLPQTATAQSIKPLSQWQLPLNAGRRYAALSGDWNPIHLWHWSARLFGFKQPIMHGMHGVASALAAIQQQQPLPVRTLSVQFKSPLPLPSTVEMYWQAASQTFALSHSGQTAVAAVTGDVGFAERDISTP